MKITPIRKPVPIDIATIQRAIDEEEDLFQHKLKRLQAQVIADQGGWPPRPRSCR